MNQNGTNSAFPREVRARFAFLEGEGFVPTEASPRMVSYQSGNVFIEVSHGPDGEVSISFGRRGKDEKFSFTLFLRLVAPGLEKSLGERLVNQPTQMSKVLADLADALRREGKSIVAGEDSIFERMKGVRWWDFPPEALKRS